MRAPDFFPRLELLERVRAAMADSPVVALLGPRQCGKTTLVRGFARRPENYFDLHSPEDRVRLEAQGFHILSGLEGDVVIDEAQLMPEIFPYLRVLADRPERPARFLLTGSASTNILHQTAESLAGRVRSIEMGGFTAEETGWENWRDLWLKGGYPAAFRRQASDASYDWRWDYIQQFMGKDLPLLAGTKLSVLQVFRFLQVMAHCHGQNWNHSEVGRGIGVSYHTVQRYTELFQGAFLVRELKPYFRNVGKRLRKAPKIYLRDSGLLHTLLSVREHAQLQAQSRYGASWEGFCIEQIIRLTRAREEECFSWSVQGGDEIDLLLQRPTGIYGFEFKVSDAPTLTKSMTVAADALSLQRLFIVYPGEKGYSLAANIEVVPFAGLAKILPQI